MTPYDIAREAWESQGEGGIEWHELLIHFLKEPGHAVVDLDDAFILARKIRHDLPDALQNTLSPLKYHGEADCWNVWLAAGNLDALLVVAQSQPLEWVSFNRRGKQKVRRTKLQTILRRHGSQSSKTSSPASASDHHQLRSGQAEGGNQEAAG